MCAANTSAVRRGGGATFFFFRLSANMATSVDKEEITSPYELPALIIQPMIMKGVHLREGSVSQ